MKNIVAHAAVTQLVIWDDKQFLEHLTQANGRMLPNSSTLVKSPWNNIPAPQQGLKSQLFCWVCQQELLEGGSGRFTLQESKAKLCVWGDFL